MHKGAQAEAGGWVLDGVKALLRAPSGSCCIGAAIYAVGGWAGLLGLPEARPDVAP
jgi:hypothetical protein